MIAYIQGKLVHKEPTYAIVEAGGLGYEVRTSLYTFTQIKPLVTVQLFTHLYVKDDVRTLYGFASSEEKHWFLHLLQVNGIGPRTAMTVLSSLNPGELQQAIVDQNVTVLAAIKGIGPKAAQRIVLELQDKLGKSLPMSQGSALLPGRDQVSQEALEALITLGISKGVAEKAIAKVRKVHATALSLEALIKQALQAS
ncbi:MAG: Holliday junction branch migration protein RuvA [Roseivirga sp.]